MPRWRKCLGRKNCSPCNTYIHLHDATLPSLAKMKPKVVPEFVCDGPGERTNLHGFRFNEQGLHGWLLAV